MSAMHMSAPSAAAARLGAPHALRQQPRLATSAAAGPSSLRAAAARRPARRARRAAAAAVAATGPPPPAAVDAADESGVLDAVVVGGGISGLITAQALLTDHAAAVPRFLLTEGRDRVGGNITSVTDGTYLWEEGPSSFQPNDAMLKAAVDAGVADELVFGDPKAPRFVYWDGRLRPTPSGPDVLTFDLMSPLGKIRAGLGAAGLRPPRPQGVEETVEAFVRRNLGDEVFFRLIEPFCSGVYAGDPTKLSMRAAFGKVWDLEDKGGSIIGGVLRLMLDARRNPPPPRDARLPPKPKGQTVGSFRAGLQTLPAAVAARLGGRVRLGWRLDQLYRERDGTFRLEYAAPDGPKVLRARAVALTVPAYVAADLLRRDAPDAAEALRSIDYPPVAAVTLAYPAGAVRPDRLDPATGALPGFGQLHPRTQGVTTLGTIYSSSLFPGRAPRGEVLLLNYIGGALNRGVADASDADLVKTVDADLRKMLLRPDAPAPRLVGARVWARAIPQANVGLLDAVAAARAELDAAGWGGLLLGGNYVSGVALGKCVEYGYAFAAQVAAAVGAGAGAGAGGAGGGGDDAAFV